MARFIVEGQRYTLKADRAEAFGLEPGSTFTVSETFTKKGYVKVWVRVKELVAPFNVFQASDFK